MTTTTKETNFQAESKKVGNSFEDKVYKTIKKQTGVTLIEKDYTVPGIGIEVDFFVKGNRQNQYIECKGGEAGAGKRPGAERTDNVKKAIANGALLKAVAPDAHYVVYFSAKPKSGKSAELMIQTALFAGYIDEVHYL